MRDHARSLDPRSISLSNRVLLGGTFPYFFLGAMPSIHSRWDSTVVSSSIDPSTVVFSRSRSVKWVRAYNVVEEGIYHGEYLDLLRRVNLNKARTVLISPTPFYPLLSSMERLCRWLGLKAPIHRHQFERALASPSYDTSRARLELGWTPQVGVAEGLRRIMDQRG